MLRTLKRATLAPAMADAASRAAPCTLVHLRRMSKPSQQPKADSRTLRPWPAESTTSLQTPLLGVGERVCERTHSQSAHHHPFTLLYSTHSTRHTLSQHSPLRPTRHFLPSQATHTKFSASLAAPTPLISRRHTGDLRGSTTRTATRARGAPPPSSGSRRSARRFSLTDPFPPCVQPHFP